MKKSIRKRIYIIIVIILIFVVVCIAIINLYIYKNIESQNKSVYSDCQRYIQLLQGYVQCIDYAKKSGIPIENSIEEEVKTYAYELNSMLENGGYGLADIIDIARLGYIYSYYGLECNQLKVYIRECYIEDEKLFNGMLYQGEESKNSAYVYDSIETDRILYSVNLIDEYDIKQGLTEWFNNHIEQAVLNNEDLTDFYDIMLDFYINSYDITELKYEYLKDNSITSLNNYKDIDYTENVSIMEVVLLDEAIFLSDIYSYDIDFVERNIEAFSKLKSAEDFCYLYEDETCLLVLSCCLRDHYIMTGSIYNDFLANNFSGMIEEHFDKYCKGKLDSIYEEIEKK